MRFSKAVQDYWDKNRDKIADIDRDAWGYWVALMPGYHWDGCETIHELTAKELLKTMQAIQSKDEKSKHLWKGASPYD